MPEEILTTTTQTAEAPAWNAGVAEEHQSAISAFSDTPGLAKGYSELFSKMGNSVRIPDENTPQAEIDAFRKKLGRPDTADGYTKPALAEGETLDTEFFGKMASIAHEGGCSDALFAKMANGFVQYGNVIEEMRKAEETRLVTEGDRQLHEDWGANYDANYLIVDRACAELIPDEELRTEFSKMVDEKGLRNNQVFARVFLGIGNSILDDKYVKGEGQVEKPKDDYMPASPKSPEMYATMEGEEGVKARAWFRGHGHVYDRTD